MTETASLILGLASIVPALVGLVLGTVAFVSSIKNFEHKISEIESRLEKLLRQVDNKSVVVDASAAAVRRLRKQGELYWFCLKSTQGTEVGDEVDEIHTSLDLDLRRLEYELGLFSQSKIVRESAAIALAHIYGNLDTLALMSRFARGEFGATDANLVNLADNLQSRLGDQIEHRSSEWTGGHLP